LFCPFYLLFILTKQPRSDGARARGVSGELVIVCGAVCRISFACIARIGSQPVSAVSAVSVYRIAETACLLVDTVLLEDVSDTPKRRYNLSVRINEVGALNLIDIAL
jgi:hypothetical protein